MAQSAADHTALVERPHDCANQFKRVDSCTTCDWLTHLDNQA